jgi:hypothetical protein
MRPVLYFLLALILIAAGFAAGHLWPHSAASSAQGCFEVSGAKLQGAQHSGMTTCDIFPCIVGIVRNNCDRHFSAIFLTYNLYDSRGLQIGSTSAMVQNLEPHGAAHFWTQVDEQPKISKFKIIGVSVAPQ